MGLFGKTRKKVLFICMENAGRSQMAEAFFRLYTPKGYEPISAGTRPTAEINPTVVQVMKELDIDISKQKPKMLTSEIIQDSIINVNMGCVNKNECPAVFMQNSIDWNIEDPKEKSIEKVREIRDDIKLKVMRFCKTLE
ncbi:MAG: arsenate reductase ArsC [Thaumarchaeota archaeon]|nr:arsenate reductase ArsC [Nitrososphaerota archaeon]